MKLFLLLCVLVLSIHGWCASIIPSQQSARLITPSHETIKNENLKEETNRLLLLDKMKAAVIGWGLITYLITIFWWAISAKNYLDKILKDVLQDIDRYPS